MSCPSPTRHRRADADFLGGRSHAPVDVLRDSSTGVLARLRRDDAFAQFARFVLVGGASTALYATLFLSLQGIGSSYLSAHIVATVASSVFANELHRRLTFHAEERVGWLTAQIEAGGVSFIGLVATSAALGGLDAVVGAAHPFLQISLVVAVTGLIGLMRFIALRWIFRPAAHSNG